MKRINAQLSLSKGWKHALTKAISTASLLWLTALPRVLDGWGLGRLAGRSPHPSQRPGIEARVRLSALPSVPLALDQRPQ